MTDPPGRQHAHIYHLQEINLSRLSRWIRCVCVITFNLEIGQVCEDMYPPGSLTHEEEMNLNFLSFPDSNSTALGDSVFTVRFRHREGAMATFLYAHCFFRQEEGSIRCS